MELQNFEKKNLEIRKKFKELLNNKDVLNQKGIEIEVLEYFFFFYFYLKL